MSFGVDMNSTLFFDSQAVIDALDEAERKNHMRIGAKLRRRQMRKLRRRKGSADPGEPPHVHAKGRGRASLKKILFGWDPQTGDVVVGPIKLNSTKPVHSASADTVPELMEFGGVVKKPWWESSVRYEPRPSAEPSLEEEIQEGTIADVWQDSVGA